MSISKINFRQLRQENLKDTFAAFERAFDHLGIQFYLIGALARDTWFADKGIRALGTKDIDFAVMISDKQQFDTLKDYLVKQEKFTTTLNEYTLRDPKGYEVDLFPFGELEIEGRKITDKEGLVHTNISGFREVFENATQEVSFDNKHTFHVASLAGIVILKLIAWDDRPEIRTDDLADVATIIKHYFVLEEQLIYDSHVDLFEETFYDLTMIAARVLGREIGAILKTNELLYTRVISILREKSGDIKRRLREVLQDEGGAGLVDYQSEVIQQITNGIDETKTNES
jgi:predicted nucleotidyltransferase